MKKTKKPLPPLFSLAVHIKPELPPRAEMLPKIESGEIDHIDFPAIVFQNGPLRAPFQFREQDLSSFARSFEGLPFLRNHDQYDIEARDGTILTSEMIGRDMKQTIRLTTRKGMVAFVEGQIDRFSIGWHPPALVLCSICKTDWLQCSHMPGRKYDTPTGKQTMLLIQIEPQGKETSAVNTPASDGTGLLTELQDFKAEVIGDELAVTHTSRLQRDTNSKGVSMKVKVRRNGEILMVEETEVLETDERITEPTPALAQIESNRQAAASLLGEAERLQAIDAQLQESQNVLVAQCAILLDSGLSTSRLPAVVQRRIRKQFSGRAFQPNELHAAITEARSELEELGAGDGNGIQGPSRGQISVGLNGPDQFRLAVEDLLGMERSPAEANIRVHKLSGIRDAYVYATGDSSFVGGYHPETALVTANFPQIVANVQNKMLIKAWKDFENVYGWWQKIVTIEHFTNLNDVTWVRTGTIASLPQVLERGEYLELPIGDQKETSTWGKYGGYVPLTIEAVLRDDLRAFLRMPREVALAGIRNISALVAAIFTTASGAGPTMNDTGALFNSTVQTTKGGHVNLLTTALGTDYVAWNAVAAAMFKKKMWVKDAAGYYGLGKPCGIYPKFCLHPVDIAGAAAALFIPDWKVPAQNVSAVSPKWGGIVEPITVPEWTDATDWAAVMDPNLIPGIMLGEIFGEKPQIFSASSEIDPAMFANDESRLKVRQIVTVGVADDLPLHKSNVAG